MMALNKLLLLIIFTLSFAHHNTQIKVRNEDDDPKVVEIKYFSLQPDTKGIISVNYEDLEGDTQLLPIKSKSLSDFDSIFTNFSVENNTFTTIPLEEFDNLKTSTALTAKEQKCAAVTQFFDQFNYGLYGYTVLALEELDLAPSITALIKNGLTKITYTDVPQSKTEYYEDILFNGGCNTTDNIKYLTYGIRKSGVVDTECFPNNKIPSVTKQCTTNTTYDPKLIGYMEGNISNPDNDTIKEALLRFGPVLYETESHSRGIILGWNKSQEVDQEYQWVYVTETTNKDTEKKYTLDYSKFSEFDDIISATVLMHLGPLEDCDHPTLKSPIDICKCPDRTDPATWYSDPRTKEGQLCDSCELARGSFSLIFFTVVLQILAMFW